MQSLIEQDLLRERPPMWSNFIPLVFYLCLFISSNLDFAVGKKYISFSRTVSNRVEDVEGVATNSAEESMIS